MSRIEIQLDDNDFLPGNEVTGSIVLTVDKPIHMRALNLHVDGKEKTSITVSTGKSAATYHAENRIIDMRQSLMDEGDVQPGRYSEKFRFLIPDGALPSYEGRNSRISYEIKVRADIPRYLDVKAHKIFRVRSQQKESAGPIEATSTHEEKEVSYTKRKVAPAITVRLPRDCYNTGETIQASVMYTNPTGRKIRNIGAVLYSREFATAKRIKRTQKLSMKRFLLPMENIYEGIFSNFQIRIPEEYNHSFEGMYSSSTVMLKLYLDIRWARDVYVEFPIHVLTAKGDSCCEFMVKAQQ